MMAGLSQLRRRSAKLIRRFSLAIGALAILGATPAWSQRQTAALTDQDRSDVARVERYINGISTLKADFTQIDPKGNSAHGIIYIKRPGGLRVQYKPPAKLLIVATKIMLIVWDGEYGGEQYIPLRATPAGLLIQKNLKFSGKIKVVRVERGGATLALHIAWSDRPERGRMILQFVKQPLSLLGWTVIDGRGQPTKVVFSETKVGLKLDKKLFLYIRPSGTGPKFNDGSR